MIESDKPIKPMSAKDYFDWTWGKLAWCWGWHWQIVRLEDGSEYYREFLGLYSQTKGPDIQ